MGSSNTRSCVRKQRKLCRDTFGIWFCPALVWPWQRLLPAARAPNAAIELLMSDGLSPVAPETVGHPRIVQDFAQASHGARDITQLRQRLHDAARALGFHYFLLQSAAGHAWLADLPPGWTGAAPSHDAVLATAAQSYAPFLWSDISRLIALTQGQRD